MTTTTIELSSARRKLTSALGEDRRALYLAHMKRWFRKMSTKEAFDAEARKLLPDNLIHLHNNFLLAILNKCQTLANASDNRNKNNLSINNNTTMMNNVQVRGPPPSKSRRKLITTTSAGNATTTSIAGGSGSGSRQGFEALKPLLTATHADSMADIVDAHLQKQQQQQQTVNLYYLHRDHLLPDSALMQGRILITAWEGGLEGVGVNVVNLVIMAMEQLLKSIINRLVMRRKGYKYRDRCWPHAIGSSVTNPWLFNTNRLRNGQRQVTEVVVNAANPLTQDDPLAPVVIPSLQEDDEREALMELVCSKSSRPSRDQPVSVFELFEVMQQEKRTLIPSHSVHAINIERVMSRLHHEGHDD